MHAVMIMMMPSKKGNTAPPTVNRERVNAQNYHTVWIIGSNTQMLLELRPCVESNFYGFGLISTRTSFY
jgi:hypothetical protein